MNSLKHSQDCRYISIFINKISPSSQDSSEELMDSLRTAKLLASVLLASLCVRAEDVPLSPYYYDDTCPLAELIVKQTVGAVVYRDPRMAASLLRLHFHDCFVLVCASNHSEFLK